MAEYREDRVGQQLGPYRLTRLLGEGGFGEVYEADHRLLQQKRAIKLLLERHFHDPNQRERFLREARTLATLEHPNILPVLEVGEEGSVLYLVMPFYRRGTLNDLLKQRTTPLPLAEVEHSLAQMCAAVGYAHARNIAHLDLKPENMLLHEDGRLVLSDFGLAHLIKQGRLEAGSSASWGTPYYMAPEHIRGEPQPRSDLYALGIILYQLLTNQRPFTGTTPEAVMMKHLLEVPPPLRAVSPTAPATLEPVIQKALEKQPENRYPTAEALLADFRAALGSLSSRPIQTSVSSTPQMNVSAPAVQTPISVPLNKAQTTATVCEIDNCGVLAIGRCSTCKRAFCGSHQAYALNPSLCAPCAARILAPRDYFSDGSARTVLLTSGVQPIDIYRIQRQREPKKGFFDRGERWVDMMIPVGRGWILGEFRWKYGIPDGDVYRYVEEDWLTALLDKPRDDLIAQSTLYWQNGGVFPVRPCSGGYTLIMNDHAYLTDSPSVDSRWKIVKGYDPAADDPWIAVVQAVRRLTGESS